MSEACCEVWEVREAREVYCELWEVRELLRRRLTVLHEIDCG
jgi:hypothetical protein